ncbi:DUF6489 family protein [Candidatus Albibeggiatoa sp. nov. NOAA]|uniref:DUF6489 family protein n=1 Tax=Candidatus Albibeggiatoa sp. nov. NOAA TaxID=3162724 RepID=UPI0032F3D86F|nr:DUF6489 family protein [Thiotrichaceae bacterium]
MKINIDIEATPQEIRSFFGLPNLEPLQDEMVDMMRKNMTSGIEGFDPLTMIKAFTPESSPALSALQNTFWKAMMGQKATKSSETDSESI